MMRAEASLPGARVGIRITGSPVRVSSIGAESARAHRQVKDGRAEVREWFASQVRRPV